MLSKLHPLLRARRLPDGRVFPRLLLCALGAALGLHPGAHAQGGDFRVQTASQIPLSIAQEAEGAIEKAQRWLTAQPPDDDLAQTLLRRYALAPTGKPFTIGTCDLTPLQHAYFALPAPTALTNLTAAIDPKTQPQDPAWRERLALALINTQRITPQGGTWGSPQETLWAILTLRNLLNDAPPITVEGPLSGAEKRE